MRHVASQKQQKQNGSLPKPGYMMPAPAKGCAPILVRFHGYVYAWPSIYSQAYHHPMMLPCMLQS